MKRLETISGIVAPLDRENVDTDAIIPKQFLKSTARTGYGANLFDAWRYRDEGDPSHPAAVRQPNPEFVLNQPRYRAASILLARNNFGCGSSRAHAQWSLVQAGFEADIIDPGGRQGDGRVAQKRIVGGAVRHLYAASSASRVASSSDVRASTMASSPRPSQISARLYRVRLMR